jgi:hypothetical protein
MSGLIFGGMLNGVGQGAALLGANATRDIERQDSIRLAAEERRQTAREVQDQIAMRAAGSDDAKMERLLAKAGLVGGAGGGGGVSPDWFTPGTPAFTEHALQAGMSEPALEKLLKSIKTGDRSGYDEVAPGVGPNPDGTNLEEVRQKRSSVTDQYLDAKTAALAELSKDRTQGKNRDDIAKGRATEQNTGIVQGVIEGKTKAEDAAKIVGAGKGELPYGKGGVDAYTGSPDAVGKSTINKNNADAGESAAKGAAATSGSKDQTLQSLTQERISADKSVDEAAKELSRLRTDMKDMGEKDKVKQREAIAAAQAKLSRYEEERDALKDRIRNFTTTTPSGRGKIADAETKPAAAKVDSSTPQKAQTTAASPYKEGQRLIGPGGKTYIVKNGKPEAL